MPKKERYVGLCVNVHVPGEGYRFALNEVGHHHFRMEDARLAEQCFYSGSYHVTAYGKCFPNETEEEAIERVMLRELGSAHLLLPKVPNPLYFVEDGRTMNTFYGVVVTGYEEVVGFRRSINSGGILLLKEEDIVLTRPLLHEHRHHVPRDGYWYMQQCEREALGAALKSTLVSI